MFQLETNLWLHRFALLTALATLALIGLGGLVTSHEAGLSVPDWPTSYGYNMFLFPLAQWWHGGNVFYEHSHRLFASGVGLLTTILAVWLWLKESRNWLRWLGVAAFIAVVGQGVLGGLRVMWLKDHLGIFHATLAQLFFALTCAIALFTSRWWRETALATAGVRRYHNHHWPFFAATALILFQLILGATMRHQHAGLAISDFPLAHGKLWPATDPESILRYNQRRVEISAVNPITAFQVQLQMAHRLTAMMILVAVALCARQARKLGQRAADVPSAELTSNSLATGLNPQSQNCRQDANSTLRRLADAWLGLILLQAGLGATTVLTDKAADVATAHVLVGALLLAVGVMMCIISPCSPKWKRDA